MTALPGTGLAAQYLGAVQCGVQGPGYTKE